VQERVNIDASKCADLIKKIHEQARTNIEKMNNTYEKHAGKGHKKIVFEPGQLVWVHLRKEQFLNNTSPSYSHVQMVHSKCFDESMIMHMRLIFQASMV
jgi:hypothetical protein